MADSDNYETTDVVVAGCGPTGAMLSAYLSRFSISHIVLEKEDAITTDPRGIALDEDGIRFLQGLGLYDAVFSDIGTCMQTFKFIGGTETVLDKKEFLGIDYGTTEGGTGHVGFICHKQPTLEKHLRGSMTSEFCQLRTGCSVVGISQDEDWTYCRYQIQTPEANTRQLRSRFLVGADGKTGFTRKRHLEPLGVVMEAAHNAFYDETWVALNWEISLPDEKSHPDFPLWALGYTPEQVYDLFFPINFRFLCNPDRPAVCGRFGLPSDRLWRFEFVVKENEDGDELATPEMVRKVVFPYITHAGARYGLPNPVQYPEDCIRVLRSRPFRFAARICNRWSHGRVILCGDAAHVLPPFGGQGIASGFRDAISLAWRLAFLCRPEMTRTNRHEGVLSAWYLERKQQLERSLAATIDNGRFVTERRPWMIFCRTVRLLILNLFASGRRQLRLGQRKEGMVRYQHRPGMPFVPGGNGGRCLPQVYCSPLKAGQEPKVVFSDDIIFGAHKKGIFQLLVYLEDPATLAASIDCVSGIEEMSKGEIRSMEISYIIGDTQPVLEASCARGLSLFRLASGEEFARSPLCAGRPAPQFYDPHVLKKTLQGHRFVFLRPDRFIFETCEDRPGLERAVAALVAWVQEGK